MDPARTHGPIKDNPTALGGGGGSYIKKLHSASYLELLQFPKDGLSYEHVTGRRLIDHGPPYVD